MANLDDYAAFMVPDAELDEDDKRFFQWIEEPEVQAAADRIHQARGRTDAHSPIHSCGCYHVAIAEVKSDLTYIKHMYWPDGQGGNAWDAVVESYGSSTEDNS